MQDKDNNHVIKHTKKIENLKNNKSLESLIKDNLLGISSLMKKMQNVQVAFEDGLAGEIMDLISDSKLKRKTSIHHRRREKIEGSILNEMNSKGFTAYGLFNGLTHYLTHSGEVHETDHLYGKASKTSSKALQMIVKYMTNQGCLN